MFAYLFSALFQFLAFVGFAVLIYQIFLSDYIKAKRLESKNLKDKYASLDKIAQVKLVSDDAKDIEKFITDNAQYLSDETVKQLVARIEMIKADQVINADTILKKRIEDLDSSRKQALEVFEEEPIVVKRASRKK